MLKADVRTAQEMFKELGYKKDKNFFPDTPAYTDEYRSLMFTETSDSTSLGNALFSIYDRRNNDKELDIIEWLTSEYKEPILTDKEKARLKKIIKSKTDSVIYISKIVLLKGTENEFTNIVIATKDSLEGVAIPDMPFEGMKLEREYSLEELGL